MGKKKKISRLVDRFITGIGIIFFIFLLSGMLSGSSIIFTENELLRYLITISFILAGFTFLALIEEEKSGKLKKEGWLKVFISSSSWLFLLAGFFLLTFMFTPYIPKEAFLSPVFENSGIYIGMMGLIFFWLGSLSLVISIYVLKR